MVSRGEGDRISSPSHTTKSSEPTASGSNTAAGVMPNRSPFPAAPGNQNWLACLGWVYRRLLPMPVVAPSKARPQAVRLARPQVVQQLPVHWIAGPEHKAARVDRCQSWPQIGREIAVVRQAVTIRHHGRVVCLRYGAQTYQRQRQVRHFSRRKTY